MKATLEFTLPEEQDDFDCALSGIGWRSVVHQFIEHVRRKYKDGAVDPTWASVLEELAHLIEGEGLDIYESSSW